MKHFIFGLIFIFLCDSYSYAQICIENEENNVINDLLYKMIDGERFVKLNKTIVYFDLKQNCNLDKRFIGNYKTNKLIDNLMDNRLESRLIDSTKINKIIGIRLVFNDTINYNNTDYLSNNIIGTLSISRISFNKAFNSGYFYYSVYCGEECGWGYLVEIKKVKGNWIIAKYINGYVS